MLALHNECLTRRYLLNRLNLLEGLLGLGLGMLCVFEGLLKLGPLRLRVTLQGLVLLDNILELFLHLADSGLMLLAEGLELLLHLAYSGFLLFSLDALLGRFDFGLE